jgi:hypothetical protein
MNPCHPIRRDEMLTREEVEDWRQWGEGQLSHEHIDSFNDLCNAALGFLALQPLIDWYDADHEDAIALSRTQVGQFIGRHPAIQPDGEG